MFTVPPRKREAWLTTLGPPVQTFRDEWIQRFIQRCIHHFPQLNQHFTTLVTNCIWTIIDPIRCTYLAAVIPGDQKGRRLNIWWESVSPWSNPMMVKLDELLWFGNDFQKLNKVSNFGIYPMPWVDKLVGSLRRLHFSSTHKFRTCYWQILYPLSLANRAMSGICTWLGLAAPRPTFLALSDLYALSGNEIKMGVFLYASWHYGHN